MKMAEALAIIDGKPTGFMVAFDRRDGCIISAEYFPEKHAGERLIETEHQAWELARRFSLTAPSDIENIYVVDHQFRPVAGYRERAYRRKAL